MKKIKFVIRNLRVVSTIKWYLLKFFTGYKTSKFKVLGHDMYLDLRTGGISRALAFYGKREEDMLLIIRDIIKPGMKIFDLGANMGFYSLEMSRLLDGNGQLLSVEPDPRNIPMLKRNLGLLGQKNVVTLFEGAVGDKDQDGYVSPAEKSNLTTVSDQPNGQGDTRVCMRTIESLAKEYLDGKINLVRMDIEGYEVEVLNAGSQFFQTLDNCNILFECHPNTYNEEHSLIDVLKTYLDGGFRVSKMVCTGHGRNIFEEKQIAFSRYLYSDGFDRYFYHNVSEELALKLAHQQPKAVRYMLLTKD